MKIIVASDHAGFTLKNEIINHLREKDQEVEDGGPEGDSSCDYSQFALAVARKVAAGEFERGVLICGTGLGMSMAANRTPGIRAALCTNEFLARMSRAHNNSNILCLGERVTGRGLAFSILDVWLETEFEGGRHQRRIDIFDRVS